MNTNIDVQNIWHPYAPAVSAMPAFSARQTKGTNITLENGQTLIDGISSWWCAGFGHRPEPIVQAMRQQLESMSHVMFAGFTHEPAISLTEKLLKLLPDKFQHVFYADSGSVAVECALKMAIQYQYAIGREKKSRIATLLGDYHGDTIGAMAVSDPSGMHKIFQSILPSQIFLPKPMIPFDGVWSEDAFQEMEEVLSRHADELAAVIVEPIFQGANAMWLYHPNYLVKLREACDRLGIVLIFDEIATGFWRTGKLFAWQYANVLPDVICLGKALTGGCITLACAISSDKIAAPIQQFLHGPTFMANPLACAAASASMDIAQNPVWQQNVSRIEKRLHERLAPLRDIANVRDVRNLGAIGVLEVETLPSPQRVRQVVEKTGVWLRPYDHFIYTMPPFTVTEEEVDKIVFAMGELALA